MVDIRLLLQFAAVAETRSFSVAARQLGLTQPRLSVQIRKLEDLLGVSLFYRNSRNVSLTSHGQDLLETVTPLVSVARTVLGEVERRRQGTAGQLRIGLIPLGERDTQMAVMLTRFAQRFPELGLEVEMGSPDAHLARLAAGQLDIATVLSDRDLSGYDIIKLREVAFAVMLTGDDPLVLKERLTFADFAGCDVAMMARNLAPAMFDLFNAPLIAAGARPVYVPELRRSLLRDMPGLVVTTIVPTPAEARLRYDVVRKTVAGVAPLTMCLTRWPKTIRPPAEERFWAFVKKEMAASAL